MPDATAGPQHVGFHDAAAGPRAGNGGGVDAALRMARRARGEAGMRGFVFME